jgi:hypothetical protein
LKARQGCHARPPRAAERQFHLERLENPVLAPDGASAACPENRWGDGKSFCSHELCAAATAGVPAARNRTLKHDRMAKPAGDPAWLEKYLPGKQRTPKRSLAPQIQCPESEVRV